MKIAIHLGLGDTIACAAIIAKLAQEGKTVYVPCWIHNQSSVRTFFAEYDNVHIWVVKDHDDYLKWMNNQEGWFKVLKLGVYNTEMPQLPGEDFVQWFYRQAGMDISEKDKFCPILNASKQLTQINATHKHCIKFNENAECTEYEVRNHKKLIHVDENRGFFIKKEYLELNDGAAHYFRKFHSSPLVYADLIMHTEEIHCIDSSMIHLVECFPTSGKLFYHKYARPHSPDYKYLKKDWQVIN